MTDYTRLGKIFDKALLDRSFFVVVGAIETPPLSKMGLGSLEFFETNNYGGITYGDTYYILPGQDQNESLHFHELIHTIQWDELGFEGFVAAYGIGLLTHGYRNSPLEVIAYDLQEGFDSGEHLHDVESQVRQHAKKIKS